MPARQLSFGHDALAQRVVGELVASLKPGAGSSTEPALVVGVFGEWGAGKSRLLQTIADALPRGEGEQALTVVVPFNAWRFEREEQLLVPLLRVAQQSLRKALEDSLAPDIPRNEQLSDRLVLLGDLAQTVYQHGGRELLQTALAAQGVALKLPELKPEAGEPQPSMWARWRQRREALAQARRLAMPGDSLHSLYYDFLEHLKAVTGRNPVALALHRERLKYRGLGWWPQLRWRLRAGLGWVGTGELPAEADFQLNLVFLVDDLDRCLPDKAVEVLEAIKLFLEVEGCAFVLALDEEVVERGIAHRYRDYTLQGREGLTPITGAEYLEKLVHLPVRLPRPTRAEAEDFLAGRHAELFGAPGAPNALARLVAAITPSVPRKLCRMVDLLDMADQLAMPLGGSGPERREWLAVACALQLFAPSLYRYLRLRGATLLLTLADWRADARLRDLDALREQLAKEVREVASPAQLNYRLVLLRLPDLCATALQNRSGFDLLELLAQVGELRQRAPLSSTQLGALLAFTEAKPEEGAPEVAASTAPAAAVPDAPPRIEPAMPAAAAAVEQVVPAASLAEAAPSPAATDVRLEDERGLLEALVSGDTELVRFALSREGGALQGNSLPAVFWDRLWTSPWLARIEAWVDEGMPPGAVEQNLRELRPHLSQAMAMQMLQRFGAAMHSVLRRPSWARQVDANPVDKGPLRLMSPLIGEGLGVWLVTRDAEGAAGWRVPRGWRCATWTAWTNTEGDFQTELKLGADETFGVYSLLTLRRQGSPRPSTQRLRWIETGSYLLGSPASETGRGPDEPTPGVVRVEGFWMADTACTLGLWWTVMADRPDAARDGDHDDEPVTGISPAEAAEFLRRLGTLLPICAVRLPSEVEWECACRAGTTTPWSFGAELTPGLANTALTGSGPCPVASLPPNPWGLYEMHGNVAEICRDWMPPGVTGSSSASDMPDLVALRGGSFADPPAATRSAASRTLKRGERGYDVGFRFTLRDQPKATAGSA